MSFPRISRQTRVLNWRRLVARNPLRVSMASEYEPTRWMDVEWTANVEKSFKHRIWLPNSGNTSSGLEDVQKMNADGRMTGPWVGKETGNRKFAEKHLKDFPNYRNSKIFHLDTFGRSVNGSDHGAITGGIAIVGRRLRQRLNRQRFDRPCLDTGGPTPACLTQRSPNFFLLFYLGYRMNVFLTLCTPLCLYFFW